MPSFHRAPEQHRTPRFKTNIHTVATLIRERDIVFFSVRCDTISDGGVGARDRGLESLVVGDMVALELYIPVLTHALLLNSIVRYIH